MPKCTICHNPNLEKIDKALIAGGSIRDIAKQFKLNSSSVSRHKQNHLPDLLMRAEEARRDSNADSLFDEIRKLRTKAESIANIAEDKGDYRTALAGIRELVRIVELMAKLRGELQEQTSINIVMNPKWITMRTAILQSLEPYPEARIKLAEVLTNAE